jgi:acetyl esterase/lipase
MSSISNTAADVPAQEKPSSASTPTQKEPLLIIPKPYWSWWNPNLPWLDLLFCRIMSWFLPLYKIAEHSPTSDKGRELNNDMRIKFDKSEAMAFSRSCQKWSKACGGSGLAQCVLKVPRRAQLLHEYNLVDKDNVLLKQVLEKELGSDDKFVHVRMWCPASLVLQESDERRENECGCIEVEFVDLKSIPKNVPVVLWFHGGGLTLCHDKAGWSPKITAILDEQKKLFGGDSVPPLVVISVDYRLAPDHPLPAASIDALSTLEYCLKDDTERTIHVGGESAGAYLALQTAFAGHIQYPGRIQSTLAMIPFLSPAADSMSCYMNQYSTPLVTTSWLRWCWRAALEMDDIENDEEEEKDVIAVGSNRTVWNKSKWKQDKQWQKFLEPMEGIPSGLGNESASKYIVAVNKADPLHDEGNELMRRLKDEGANVDYIEAMGSHAVGFEVDRKAMAKLMNVWRAAIFDK